MHAAPAVSCASYTGNAHTSIQVQRRQSDIPCAMVLTVSFELSSVIGLSCHRHLAVTTARFNASVEASGPHDFAVRKPAPSSEAPPASTASRPAFVTIAIAPLWDETAGNMDLIWVWREGKYFYKEGWTADNRKTR